MKSNLETLPVKTKLDAFYYVSIIIILLILFLSVIGILNVKYGIYGNDPNLNSIFWGQDFIHLILGMPIFLLILYLAKQKSIVSFLLWPGMFFYIIYDYFYFLLGTPMSYYFLGYLLIVILSIYTLIGFLINIDIEKLFGYVHELPNKLIGVILVAFSCLTFLSILLSPGGLIPSLQSHININLQARLLWTLDPIFQIPSFLIVGILLLLRKPMGYVLSGGLLLQSCIFVNGKTIADIANIIFTGNPTGGSNRIITWVVLGFIGVLLLLSLLIYLFGINKSLNKQF
jgi:hypothetical protein